MAGGSSHPSMQTPIGPSVWPVSDGRAGNAAQVKAIAAALGERSRWMKLAHIKGAAHQAGPIGKEEGDEAEVAAPAGVRDYEIAKVVYK